MMSRKTFATAKQHNCGLRRMLTVLRSWGRIGTHGRTSIETCVRSEEAETVAVRTLQQKAQRGYVATPRTHLADTPG